MFHSIHAAGAAPYTLKVKFTWKLSSFGIAISVRCASSITNAVRSISIISLLNLKDKLIVALTAGLPTPFQMIWKQLGAVPSMHRAAAAPSICATQCKWTKFPIYEHVVAGLKFHMNCCPPFHLHSIQLNLFTLGKWNPSSFLIRQITTLCHQLGEIHE